MTQLHAQADLKGTAWTVTQIASTNASTPPQNVSAGEQILEISADGNFTVTNFLGIAEQTGRIVADAGTLILGKDGGYFAVFTILENSADSLKVKYLPYEPSANYLNVTLAKHQTEEPEAEVVEEATAVEGTDFSGKWTFSQGTLKLDLDITQTGTELSGTHCSGENCEGKYQIKGTVNGSSATISLLNDAGAEQGTAQVQSLGNSISWGVTSDISKVNTVDSIVLKKAN